MIDQADATPAEKEEAKGIVRKVMEHPLTAAAFGAAISGAVAKLGS